MRGDRLAGQLLPVKEATEQLVGGFLIAKHILQCCQNTVGILFHRAGPTADLQSGSAIEVAEQEVGRCFAAQLLRKNARTCFFRPVGEQRILRAREATQLPLSLPPVKLARSRSNSRWSSRLRCCNASSCFWRSSISSFRCRR